MKRLYVWWVNRPNVSEETTDMAKRKKGKGRSARNGNQPAPYTKYKKQPYRYSASYYSWKEAVKSNRVARYEKPKEQYSQAAE